MKPYKIILILFVLPLCGLGGILSAQTSTENYIRTVIPIVPVTDAINLNTSQSLQTIQYFDGLGRHVETVQKGITPLGNDLVTYTEYNAVGLEWKQWLPAATTGNNGAFVNFNNLKNNIGTQYGETEKDYSFVETVYEPSPLNRVKEQFGVGNAWKTANKRATIDYGTNASEVKYFFADNNNQLIGQGTYAPNTLYKIASKDEDGKQTIEYKDKLGRVVMQRNGTNVDTYYVSNDLGQLCYVIPPLAADALEIGTYTETTEVVKKYGYVYKYDERGNCIYKKLPGCEPIYMAYDLADRLVQSQDGKQRVGNKWTVIKYDVFGRVVFTGSITDTSTNWAVLNSNTYQYKNTVIVETCTGGIYSNTYFADAIPLMVNYYDNYSFISNLPSTIQANLKYTVNTGYSKAYPETATDISSLNAKGMLTGTLVYLLDGSNKYSVVLNYYDDKGRIVQTRSTNHLGGYDIAYNDLDFTGKPNKTLKEHNIAGGNTISELYTYTYDHIGRVIKTDYTLNGQPSVTLADMTNGYDELGRLKQKKRHNGADTESFQYNIRNWISKITSGGFEENLFYNTKPSIIEQATPCYNGNICYSTWTYNDATRGYEYEYDELNRFTGGYAYNNNEMLVDYQYSEWFNYNKMGNITHLLRHGDGGEFYDLDNLSFTYDGNQLTNIEDENEPYNLYNVKEYQDKASEYNELEYDVNGNLIKDLDREIVTIKYNSLNLPEIVQFKNGNMIKNLYNAGGQKLRSDYYTRLTTITPLAEGEVLEPIYTPTDYSYNGTVYIDNKEYKIIKLRGPILRGKPIVYLDRFTLNLLYNPEGYVTTVTSPQYFYYRKDHLGNNREVWCANTAQTVQRTQYYPSGLPWAESTGASVQNKKYNGKEFVEAHGLDEYDSSARWYYPAIMRTTTLDPMAEKYYGISPYAWCHNNPVSRIDPDGMDDYITIGGRFIKSEGGGHRIIILNGSLKLTLSKINIHGTLLHWRNDERQIVANVINYYANKLNISSPVVISTIHLNSLAFAKNKKIYFHPMGNGGISPLADNYYNLMSIIEHEHFHTLENIKGREYQYSDHARVYLNQIESKTFGNTTEEFKEGIIGSFFIRIWKSKIEDNSNTYKGLINEFNNLHNGYEIIDRDSGGLLLINTKNNLPMNPNMKELNNIANPHN